VRRELIGGCLDLVDRPPAVFAHKVALEIIPTTDIDLVLVDADEIEALPLTRGLAGVGHAKKKRPWSRPSPSSRQGSAGEP
jgi:hypothetical protein